MSQKKKLQYHCKIICNLLLHKTLKQGLLEVYMLLCQFNIDSIIK